MSAPNLSLLRGPRTGAPVRDILSDLPPELRSLALRLLYREQNKRYVRVDYRFAGESGYETRQCFVPLPPAPEGKPLDSLPQLPDDIVCGGLFNSIFRYMESPANASNPSPRTLWLDDATGPHDPVVFDQIPIEPWEASESTRFTRFRWYNFLQSLREFPKVAHPWVSAEDALFPVAQPELHHIVVASLIVSPDAGADPDFNHMDYGIAPADLPALFGEGVQAGRARRLGMQLAVAAARAGVGALALERAGRADDAAAAASAGPAAPAAPVAPTSAPRRRP